MGKLHSGSCHRHSMAEVFLFSLNWGSQLSLIGCLTESGMFFFFHSNESLRSDNASQDDKPVHLRHRDLPLNGSHSCVSLFKILRLACISDFRNGL